WKLLYPLSPGLRRLPGAIISRIPIFGGLYRLIVEGQLARTLGFVAASDAPLKQGLEAAGESLSSAYAREEILQVRGRMDTGSSLADVLAGHPLFSRKLVAVARVAERQGLVESLFLHVAKRNRRKLADAPNIEKVLEPLFMTLMGIIIGILVIAMYLPIFRLGAVV
ncbi:MAG: hypothetical protein GY731_10650, partial [Gammaproteobacteria bacterium]|nr:hypothetical protein [Gammaproteobacteria bacterium]